jgi:hypothetical protein
VLTYRITNGLLVDGDAFTGSLTRATGENVDTYVIGQGTLALSTNYVLTVVDSTLTIDQKSISVTADSQTKEYGIGDPTLTYAITSGGSLVSGDTFTGALTRAVGENIGAYAIGQGTLALSSNYALTFVGADLTIATRAIAVAADAQTKVYGEDDPSLTYRITSGELVAGDAFTGALTRAVGENIGAYVIGQGTLALSSNYALTFVGANLEITTRAIEVTADDQNKVYGDADPALSYQVTTGALVAVDAFTGSLTRESGEDVGAYVISQGTLALSSNYALTYVGADLTIEAKPITVTANAEQSKTYGEDDPTFSYTISVGSLEVGDTLSGALSRASGSSVGRYAMVIGTLANANYAITFVPDTFEITRRPVTITADDVSKTYGEDDPILTYRVTSGSLAAGDSLVGSLVRTDGNDVGTYAISQGTVTSVNNTNYTVTFVGGTLTIDKAPQDVLSVTSTFKTYGIDLALTSSGGSGSGAVSYVVIASGSAGCSIAGGILSTTGDNGSTCTVKATKATSANYLEAVSSNTTITVGQLAITIAAESKTKVYGDPDPSLTYTITAGALISGDTLSGGLGRVSGESVGARQIQLGTLGNPNYDITYLPADLTISQRPITVTANSTSKVFGAVDPTLTYDVTAGLLVGADEFVGAISRNGGENVGNYVIGRGTLDNSNYDITFVDGAMTITGANQSGFTLSAASTTIDYRSTTSLSTSGGNGAGLVSFSVANGTGECSVSGSTITGDKAGTCSVTATKAAEGNYLESTSNTVTITVTKLDQIISFDAPFDRAFATNPFAVTPSSTSGQAVAVTSATTSVCTVNDMDVTMVYAGTCSLSASVTESDNFNAAVDVSHSFVISAIEPAAPTLDAVTASGTTISLTFSAGSNGGDAITTYEYSLDGGVTWTAFPVGSVTSPLAVGGLAQGRTYTVAIRAVNSVDSGAVSNLLTVTIPNPPSNDDTTTTTSTTFTSTTTTVAVTVRPTSTTVVRTIQGTERSSQFVTVTTTVEGSSTTTVRNSVTSTIEGAPSGGPSSSQGSTSGVGGSMPNLKPAQAAAVVNGKQISVVVDVVESTWVEVTAGDTTMTFAAIDDGGEARPLLANGSVLLSPGDTLEVGSSGMEPGVNAAFWLFSTPILLGERQANLDGEIFARFTLPSDVEPGAHRVMIVSQTPAGDPMVVAFGVTISSSNVVDMHRNGAVSKRAADLLGAPGVVGVRNPESSVPTAAVVWALLILALFIAVGRFRFSGMHASLPVMWILLDDARWVRSMRGVRFGLPLVASVLALMASASAGFEAVPPSSMFLLLLALIGIADPFSGFIAMLVSVSVSAASGGLTSFDDFRFAVLLGCVYWVPGLASSALVRGGVVGGRFVAAVVRAIGAGAMFLAMAYAASGHIDVISSTENTFTALVVIIGVAAFVHGMLEKSDEVEQATPAPVLVGAAPMGIAVASMLVLSARTLSVWSLLALLLLGVVVAVRMSGEYPHQRSRFATVAAASIAAVAITAGVMSMFGENRRVEDYVARHHSIMNVNLGAVVGTTPVTVNANPGEFELREITGYELAVVSVDHGVSITTSSADVSGNALAVENGVLNIVRGGRVSFIAVGLEREGTFEAWMRSTPRNLGSGVANTMGVVDATYAIPVDLEIGSHTLELRLGMRNGGVASVTLAIQVVDGPLIASPLKPLF